MNIEDTRAEIGETIDAIQERLSPRRLISETKGTLIDWVRCNPLPLALVGVGATSAIALRAFQRARRRARRRSRFPTQMERIAALRTFEGEMLDRRNDPRLSPRSSG